MITAFEKSNILTPTLNFFQTALNFTVYLLPSLIEVLLPKKYLTSRALKRALLVLVLHSIS